MEELGSYSPEEIILSNLEELALRALHSHEQERAHLRELAREIVSEYTDSTSFLASLPEHRLPPLLPEENNAVLASTRRVLLAMEIRRLLPAAHTALWQEFFFPATEELNSYSHRRISYQRNPYTDAAYQRFSALLREPRATYAHSFHGACEDVYNGVSEYCILPLENTSEGRLGSFSKLIEQYEIHIVATCDVRSGENKLTRFALLRKSMAPLRGTDQYPGHFEFSCECGEETDAESILSAAKLCGLRLYRANLSPSEEAPSQTRLHAVFWVANGDLPSFLLFLATEVPDFTPIGIYPHLKAENKRI